MAVTKNQISPQTYLITVTGRLDQSQIPQLDELISHILDQDEQTLIVDLTHATYINSGGLRTLVTGWRKSKQQNGNLHLCGLNNRLQEIFEMVGFDKVFTIYKTKEIALQDTIG